MGCNASRWHGRRPDDVTADSLWKVKMDFELEKNAKENPKNDTIVQTPEVIIVRCTG